VVFGTIAITYNVNGVTSLNLDGPTAAKIFNGGITVWNDTAIHALNPGVTLPAEPIHVVFRGDQSGTTDSFQQYLDAASNGTWGRGAGKTFNGGVGEGAKGNDGTSAAIKATEGSITYNAWSFAQAQQLSMAAIATSPVPLPWRSAPTQSARRFPGPRSRDRVTTSCSTPSRSTSRRSLAPTRS
jgi:phosphate transport system substrate-binding protein